MVVLTFNEILVELKILILLCDDHVRSVLKLFFTLFFLLFLKDIVEWIQISRRIEIVWIVCHVVSFNHRHRQSGYLLNHTHPSFPSSLLLLSRGVIDYPQEIVSQLLLPYSRTDQVQQWASDGLHPLKGKSA